MVRRKSAAVRVERGSACLVEPQLPALHVGAALALLAEAQVFQQREHRDGERVVDHRDLDLVGRDARLAERRGRGLRGRAGRDVAAALGILGRLSGAQDPHRRLLRVASDISRRDHHRAAAVRDDARLQQMQRVRDHARRHHIFDRDLASARQQFEVLHPLLRLRVSHRVEARGDRDLGELLTRRAVLVHVASCDQRIVGDERHAPGALHVAQRARRSSPHAAARADAELLAVGRRAVGEQRDLRLARGDVALGVRGVELVRTAADGRGVDHVGLDVEVLGDAQPGHAASPTVAGVIDGVDVAPCQAGLLQRLSGGLSLDLQGSDAGRLAQRVFIDADDGGVACLGWHTTPSSRSLSLAVAPPHVAGLQMPFHRRALGGMNAPCG